MHERSQHTRGQRMTPAEMDAREDAAERSLTRLLGALFEQPGVAYGLGVTVDGPHLVVSPGAALFPATGGLGAVTVGAARTLPLPTTDGDYGVYVHPDALVELEPVTVIPPQEGEPGYVAGQTQSVTLYRRALREAYARPDALTGGQGRVTRVGLTVTARSARDANWLELCTLSVTGGALSAFNDAPATRLNAHLRGTNVEFTIADGSVAQAKLSADVQETLRKAARAVTATDTDATLLAANGTRAMTGDLDLGGNGIRNLGEDLDLRGHQLLKLAGVTLADGVSALNVNVTRVGGKTAEEIISAASSAGGGGDPGAGSGTQAVVFNLDTLITLSNAQPAPVPLSLTLPDTVPAGTRTAFFQGEGTLGAISGNTVTFTPNTRLFPQPAVPFARVGAADASEQVTAGPSLGVAGSGFYFSVTRVFTDAGTRRYAHSLQRVLPDAAQATVIDSTQGTLATDDPAPPPLALNLVGSVLTWGDRAQPPTGQAATWIGGYSLVSKSSAGPVFQQGKLAVAGKLQVFVQPQVTTLPLTVTS